jgi:hypothetical protein
MRGPLIIACALVMATTASTHAKDKVFAVVPKAMNNPFFDIGGRGAHQIFAKR